MRFFEYEAREIVKRAGIPVTDFGFTTDPAQAREIAQRIGGPTVIKSQVLTGGRMKAGGVKFADTPEEAESHARDVLALEIKGHMPRGVLVDPKAEVEQEYYAGVVWDGLRKRPVMIFSPVGGIDIEQVAEEQPDKVGRRHFSNILPFSEFMAKEVIASTGVSGSALNKLVPILTRLAKLFVENDMTLAEINPLGRLSDGSFVALDAHMDMENEARGRHRALLADLGVGDEETRQAREATPFEIAGEEVDAQDHRGVAGNVTEFDGNLGLVIGAGGGSLTLFDAVRSHGGEPANYCEIGGNPSVAKACGLAKLDPLKARRRQDRRDDVNVVSNTRVDIVARGVIKACHRAGLRSRREDRDLPHSRRVGGGGLQDPSEVRHRLRRPHGVSERGSQEGRGEDPRRSRDRGGRRMSILIDADIDVHRPGHHRPRGGEPHSRVPRLRRRREDRRRRDARAPRPRGPRRPRVRHGRPGRSRTTKGTGRDQIYGSVVTVPPAFTKDAVFEAIENGIKLIVIVTERIPRRDVGEIVELATLRGARIIGPNCLGIIVAGRDADWRPRRPRRRCRTGVHTRHRSA